MKNLNVLDKTPGRSAVLPKTDARSGGKFAAKDFPYGQAAHREDIGQCVRRVLIACAVAACGAGGVTAQAQQANSEQSGSSPALREVIVTATRHAEDISKVPFNLSVYGSQQLQAANITSVAQLSEEVPNFVVVDAGAGQDADSIPIIRGINASPPTGEGINNESVRYFQSPVGIYLGNSPITGSLPLEDVERVEVLRGPQGTLYGSGTLAGAVRIIPQEPKLGVFSGELSAAGEGISHSSDLDNDVLGVVNLPIGQESALRLVAQREYDGGFIDQHDIMRRPDNNYVSGAPLLADPSDVANSPAIYFNQPNSNWSETDSARIMYMWEPNDRFKLLTSYSIAYITGQGGPTDDPSYQGGPSPIDPRMTLAPTGDYQISDPMLQPYRRTNELASIDLSYDLGFATLSSTLAYGTTNGQEVEDLTKYLLGASWGSYYSGVPHNPRTLYLDDELDYEYNETEEIRLVSKEHGGSGLSADAFDYVVGTFFQQDRRFVGFDAYVPGQPAQSLASGGLYVGPFFANGASAIDRPIQHFYDDAIYGNLTWHITHRWQVTGGARLSHQLFRSDFWNRSLPFGIYENFSDSTATTKPVFKIDTSYQLTPRSQVYATFSQGYRRGGDNFVPLTGFGLESPDVLNYRPDTTNNYEVGFKGTGFGLRYSVDAFYIDWKNPQIDTVSPYTGYNVVVNGSAASSKGGEFEVSGPLGMRGLTFNLGLAYARARLTNDFSLAAGDGGTGIVPGAISGVAGERLPGTPDFSGTVDLDYAIGVTDASLLTFDLGADYRSSTVNILSSPSLPGVAAPGYGLLHGSIQLQSGNWQLELFGTNLADRHALIENVPRPELEAQVLGNWSASDVIVRPREGGLRLTYNW